jgi:ribosome maturation factor RimP
MSEDRGIASLRALAEPIVADVGAEIYDIERAGALVRLSVTRHGGIDLDTITGINRSLSRAIDEHDPIPGAFTLEVSSPGLERRLRIPEHWSGAVGERVKVKLDHEIDGVRRLEGVVDGIGGGSVRLRQDSGEITTIDVTDIDTARTQFDWGPSPKPGGPPKRTASGVAPTSPAPESPLPDEGTTP